MLLVLAGGALTVVMLVASIGPSLAQPPEGAGCEGIITATQKAGFHSGTANQKLGELKKAHGCEKQ
jgi:hypothetical protein